ncbi:MAG: hypothetical protein ACKVJK_11330 [Methylophagaceae bacterium]|jgi:hypothetical protein|tara:strand:- start:1761 stop:2477 length:717 start_codon:yes stop_codon:yes gene_type:complete
MGLQAGDLKDMMYDIFEVDSYASKMGDDKNIVTLSFSLKEKEAADDLMNFLEKGYSFVLDSDATPGEQSDGTVKVFVELERNRDVHKNILEIVDGVKNLSNIDDFKFRYYKNFKSKPVSEEELTLSIPSDPDRYGITVTETNLDNYKNFFSNSYVDSIDLLEDTLTVRKAFAEPVNFKLLDFGDRTTTFSKISETLDIMNSYAEMLYLTKYLGDYNISKYGEKLVFENQDKVLVLKRI